MASGDAEKAGRPTGLTLETTTTCPELTKKPFKDPFSSGLTPSVEKSSVGFSRHSDVSTPASSHANPFDTDIEAIITSNENCIRKSTECTKGGTDCHVWPGQEHWRRKAKEAKKSRHSCNCLAHLSKRNRIIVKILIGLLIVGIAVGVGFGVSKPLGAGIWRSQNQN